MPVAILALAIATFGIATTEFIVAGLLPEIATEFSLSIPTAGYMATSYALGVFVGAPVLIILGGSIERKKMLSLLMILFIIGNALTAFSPTFSLAIIGRIVASLTHGAFMGIGAIIAAELVPENKKTTAIAFMFSGMTLANLVGIPLGTWIGKAISWRVTFAIITVIGIIALVGILKLLPKFDQKAPASIKKELQAFTNIHVLLAMGITVLGPAAFFTTITYIAPLMINIAGFSESAITWLLLVLGLGFFFGNIVGGKLADKTMMPLLYWTLGLQSLTLFIFWLYGDNQFIACLSLFLMAALGFATVSPIQRLVMDKAQEAGAPNLVSSVNIGFFNLGNAVGAWLGGVIIASHYGYTSLNLAGGLLAALALLLAIISGLLDGKKTLNVEKSQS
ncbi:MFS transporter [Xenorhabdus griffiniae]|uniref:MFS transporter n=1 Tax=Xenorhabdus griffiniae TaxID=351672 RepID=A0ABY9XLU9_9GAMM|nr:MFS transporter [Xenorhabdus griffiniae]MBD1228726.1 MFS transporter [Xenorhabdus griffiniae]MBE8588337.1 MFS transporter [Xenorhabdus griffiniae]WMV73909.1 MFS transporter [Xenorhabdus griffiniae]WNH03589.1 MFS transporter [Xenorhabdus griffiniae]